MFNSSSKIIPIRYVFLNLDCQSTFPDVISSLTLPPLSINDTFIFTFFPLPTGVGEYKPMPENEILATVASMFFLSFTMVTCALPKNWYLYHFLESINPRLFFLISYLSPVSNISIISSYDSRNLYSLQIAIMLCFSIPSRYLSCSGSLRNEFARYLYTECFFLHVESLLCRRHGEPCHHQLPCLLFLNY